MFYKFRRRSAAEFIKAYGMAEGIASHVFPQQFLLIKTALASVA
jgi:hypothetical protein